MLKSKKNLSALFISLLTLFSSFTAYASLGETHSSTVSNPKEMKTMVYGSKAQGINYSIYTNQVGGNQIKEYVSTTNVIFAVTWAGLSHPDLSIVLGSYWTEYSKSVKKEATKGNRRSSKVSTANIVVQKNGHMRQVTGKAYIPALLPSGVSANDIN